MTRDHRRLAAIVSADAVGYSRLMGRDDSGTLAALKAHRRDLIDPKIAEYGGRIVKSTGDGLLLEFASVVDAVRCAVDVQRGMAERNAGLLADDRLDFRIGINVGDIIIDGDDIFGDGVNVAARLQMLAEPGGICVSRVVRDQVLDKLSFAFEDLGAQDVKNITRPVEVFRVDLEGDTPPTRNPVSRRWHSVARTRGWRWVAAGLFALGLMGSAAFLLVHVRQSESASAAPPLSVAVLPFAAPDGGRAEEQFADALTRDLVLGLGRIRMVKLVSTGATEAYEVKSFDVRKAGKDLNVRYLIVGEVRHVGEQMLVDAQVIDATKGTQVWGDRMALADGRFGQDQRNLFERLARESYGAVFGAEVARADKPPAAGAGAVESVLYANNYWARNPVSVQGALGATEYFDRALRLDPNLVSALVGKASANYYVLFLDPHANHEQLVQEMDALSIRAAAIDEKSPTAWWLRAVALTFQWRWEAALDAVARAQRLDPGDSGIVSVNAEIMLFTGRPSESLELAEKALALEPPNSVASAWPLQTRCRASLALERYDDAIIACEKAASLHDWWLPHLHLVAAYTHQGQAAKAAAEKAKVLKQRPDISISDFNALRLSDNPTYLQQIESRLFSELRKAGVPEN